MIAPIPTRATARPGIAWPARALLVIAIAGGWIAVIVAVSALVAYCGEAPSPGCQSGSPGIALVAQGALAVVGITLLIAIGSSLRRGRGRLGLVLTGLAGMNYVAWGVLLDLGAHGELTII